MGADAPTVNWAPRSIGSGIQPMNRPASELAAKPLTPAIV